MTSRLWTSLGRCPNNAYLLINVIIFILIIVEQVAAVKVLDVNERLPELIEKYPDKNWLVKFYAPWCHYCQQLEPTYVKVAEMIGHMHDNLIVARVDCTKSGRTCEKYSVEAYPTIMFINKDISVKYRGDRKEKSIVDFAERMTYPSINRVNDCTHLEEAVERYGLIVLSTIKNSSSLMYQEFESIAKRYKSEYWFYHHIKPCKEFQIGEGLFILKQYLTRPIKFKPVISEDISESPEEETRKTYRRLILEWLRDETLPVYPQIDTRNFQHILNMNKLIALTVLDEYKYAKRFTPSSVIFQNLMEKLARNYTQNNDAIIFGWTSDVELVEYITITQVQLPNLIFFNSDLKYHLLINQTVPIEKHDDNEIPKQLQESKVRPLIEAVYLNKLTFQGGNTFMYATLRYTSSNINKFMRMWRANPILVSLIFGFPTIIIVFVIYTTCCYDSLVIDDDKNDDEEMEQLMNNDHLKQD